MQVASRWSGGTLKTPDTGDEVEEKTHRREQRQRRRDDKMEMYLRPVILNVVGK